MLKLYRFTDANREYWETWENNDGSHTVHWGDLGTAGQSRTVESGLQTNAQALIQKELDTRVAQGFHTIHILNHSRLLIEYAVEGMGTSEDIEKLHRLEERLNETLGGTGLGACGGGNIGNGTMEICFFVVDFEIAKSVIARDLEGTEFANFTRIYNKN